MTRPGRPAGSLGEICSRALELAEGRVVTYHTFHVELGLSRRDASVMMHDLIRRNHVDEVARVMVPGARKPVPAVTRKPPASVEDKLAALMAWPRRSTV